MGQREPSFVAIIIGLVFALIIGVSVYKIERWIHWHFWGYGQQVEAEVGPLEKRVVALEGRVAALEAKQKQGEESE